MLQTHPINPKPRAPCRNCDSAPRARGGLYCGECARHMEAFIGAAQRQQHPEACFCVDCNMGQARAFRLQQARRRAYQAMRRGETPKPPDGPSAA